MAIIQNSAIIQKLVDELELSPATEKIPTELTEKVLPVFQVNSADVNVTLKKNWVVKRDLAAGNTKTFTVPDGKTWTIKNAHVHYINIAAVNNRVLSVVANDELGAELFIATHGTNMTTGQTWDVIFNEGTAIDGETHASFFIRYIPFINDMVLTEGCTIKFWDLGNKEPTDTCAVTMMVDEQDVS